MSAETPKPQDRVRWTRQIAVEGVVEEVTGDGYRIRDADGRVHLCQRADSTVEVLGRALCSKIEGATGIRCQRPTGHTYGHEGATTEAQTAAVGYPLFVSWPAESEQPARPEVRVPNEPHGPSPDVRQKVAALIVAGDILAAVNVVKGATHWLLDDAHQYVREMSEYQTYLAAHGEKREPRVSRAVDGETVDEPPDWVNVVEDKHGDHLIRQGDGWIGPQDLPDRTELDPLEADRMRAMGFDKQPEFTVSDEDRELIRSVTVERQAEYFDGGNLYTLPLAGVVADIVWAAIRRDRERGDR